MTETELDPQETVVVKFDGGTYKVRKHLTIGEEIARKGRRSQICGGQYGAMNTSKDLDERSVAMMADIMTELDARIADAPKSWNGAEVETDDRKLINLWRTVAQALGRFPQGQEGNGRGTPGKKQGQGNQAEKDSQGEPGQTVDEEMVP